MGEPVRHPPSIPIVGSGHEDSDVAVRPLAIFLAGLAGSLVAVGAICAWLFSVFLAESQQADVAPGPRAEVERRTPGPLLQHSPREERDELRAAEERRLHAAEWIDRDRGIARIPIERAIELTAERGFPKWPAAEVTPPAAAESPERPPTEPPAEAPADASPSSPPVPDPDPEEAP
jgi:hypothetical protein